MLRITLLLIGSIITLTFIVFVCYGGLKKVQFRMAQKGGEILAYRELTGDYSQSRAAMDKIYYSLLNEYGIETFKGFGIYYDNPKNVDKDKLRSEVGCIIEDNDTSKITEFQNGCKTKTLPQTNYILTEFPYMGKISVIIALMKVYPKLNKYIHQQNLPEEGAIMEIYDLPNKKIIFRKEIINQ